MSVKVYQPTYIHPTQRPEVRQKISDGVRRAYKENPNLLESRRKQKHPSFKGKKHSLETRNKMSLSHRGRENPHARQIMIQNNPMKRAAVSKKISKIRKKYFMKHPEARQKLSIIHKGKNNPMWKGGTRKRPELGSAEWRRIRDAILVKYNNECFECGITKKLVAHHIIPRRYFEDPKDADYEENLVVLCRKHHIVWEARHVISGDTKIGKGVRVYHFVNIYNSKISENTKIGSFTEIANSVIGKNCNIQCHVSISNGCKIGDNVFIGPGARLLNDKHPGSNVIEPVEMEEGAVIGGGAVILPGVKIGKGAVVGAGSVVTKNVDAFTTVVGNPARRIK